MKIKIFQIEHDRDTDGVLFVGLKSLQTLQGYSDVNSSVYDCVFEGEVSCKNLEDVYVLFNYHHPSGYCARSLSVSDVVEVIEDEMVQPGYYFCDRIGFTPVKFDSEKTGISETFYHKKENEKIKVLFVPVGKYPIELEIENTYESMKKLLGGGLEEYMPFDDAIALVVNRDGLEQGLAKNRAVYSECKKIEMDYFNLKKCFREAENHGQHLTGYIVFTPESFDLPLSEFERTYVISSNNKAFQSGLGGYSIYGSSLDGVDKCLRMDGVMADEHGGKSGWKIEKCYLLEQTKDISAVICGDFFIAKSNLIDEKYGSLSDAEVVKYHQLFQYPERFSRKNGKIIATPFKPEKLSKER